MNKEKKNAVLNKGSHSRKLLSGIYDACRYAREQQTTCVEDPRLQASGMTLNLNVGQALPDNKGCPLCTSGSKVEVARMRSCSLFNIINPSPALRASFPARGKENRAFTLIELLVVVLIIGILAAVALPQYQLAVAKSRFTQLQTAGDALIKAYKTYYLANGEDPSTLDQLDLLPFGGTLDNTKRHISNGQMTCGFNSSYPEFSCSQGKGVPIWLYFFPTVGAERNKNKRVCRAYSELAKKVCLSAGGTLKNEGPSYTDYYLP